MAYPMQLRLPSPSQPASAHAMMLIGALLIATSFPVVAGIIESQPSSVLAFLRFTFASAVLLPFVVIRHGRATLPPLRTLASFALLGAPLAGFFYIAFEALRTTSPVNTGALFSLAPSFAALFAFLILGERTSTPRLAALATGVVGAIWVVFRGDFEHLAAVNLARGDAMFAAGTALLGLYSVLVKRLGHGKPVAITMFWTLIFGAAWLALLGKSEIAAVDWSAVEPKTWSAIAYVAVFTTLATFAMSQAAIGVIGPTQTMAYSYLNPALVALLIWATQGTAIGWQATPGIALTFASMAVLQGSGRRREGSQVPSTPQLRNQPCHSIN